MSINDYLYLNNISDMEGHCGQVPEQIKILQQVVMYPSIKNVLEIGFNAGHSADVLLSANSNIKLTSFDLGARPCVETGKKYIDEKYPNRHTLILGDSTKTVPEFIKNNTEKFDLIFIDGGHTYDIARQDILNCKKLAHQNTIVIMDDILYTCEKDYTIEVTKAWREAIAWDIVTELRHFNFENIRGFSIGKYVI